VIGIIENEEDFSDHIDIFGALTNDQVRNTPYKFKEIKKVKNFLKIFKKKWVIIGIIGILVITAVIIALFAYGVLPFKTK